MKVEVRSATLARNLGVSVGDVVEMTDRVEARLRTGVVKAVAKPKRKRKKKAETAEAAPDVETMEE